MKCQQQHLIYLNCFETSQPAESLCFSKWLFPQQYCTAPFFPCPFWHDEMHVSLLSIPYPLCSATHCSLRLRKSFWRLPEQTRHLLAVYLLLLVVDEKWQQHCPYHQSTHLHFFQHHTLNCPPAHPPLLHPLISAYVPHSWIEAVCPLVPRLHRIYSFPVDRILGINVLVLDARVLVGTCL